MWPEARQGTRYESGTAPSPLSGFCGSMQLVGTRVLVIPGAVVRSYVQPAVDALYERGIEAHLLAAPGEPGSQADLGSYGMGLARQISGTDPVEVLIGLSVGGQVAAVAASTAPSMVQQLMLISPTVDPQVRTVSRLLGRWLAGGRLERPELFLE